ncbi:MAG: hypothetical protein H0W83_14385 [Planctomycetes bacterium]|nr:hypothetical protein [Planctomycetota bacterium]
MAQAEHPYRGEAFRLLGDVALEDRGDITTAKSCYTQAITVLAQANVHARVMDRFQVPDVSRERTKPPQAMREHDGWGNLVWFQPEPGQVINADTCDWYADYQTLLAQTKRSMCFFLAGKTEAAIKDLDAMLRLDPDDKELTDRNMPSNYLRLRDDYRSGRLYATANELAHFTSRALVKVVEAEVFFETEQWDLAVAAYNRIAADERLSLSVGARAYLDYARGCALDFAGKTTEAMPFTAGFSGAKSEFSGTSTYWRALFLIGNLDKKQEVDLLTHGACNCPDPSLRLDFLLRLGQLAFCHDQDAEATRYFTALRSAAKLDEYRGIAAGKYLDLIRSRSSRTMPSSPR